MFGTGYKHWRIALSCEQATSGLDTGRRRKLPEWRAFKKDAVRRLLGGIKTFSTDFPGIRHSHFEPIMGVLEFGDGQSFEKSSSAPIRANTPKWESSLERTQ